MDFNLATSLESCAAIIEANADFVKLIYYSHIPVSFIALLVGGFVIWSNPRELINKILFGIAAVFSFWSVLDLISWMSTDSRFIMFAWSLLGSVNSLIFILCLYFVYVFIYKKDVSFTAKIVAGLSFIPILIFTPTHWNLTAFDAINCQALEGTYFVQYYYLLNMIAFLAVLSVEIAGYYKAASENRKQILILSSGVNLFLFSFFVSGYLASLLGNFELVVYGLFGMVFFMAFLGYLIVQYNAFNIKLLSVQALVTTIVLLVGSQLFFVRTVINIILTNVTLILVAVVGGFLIQSVKKEVKRKEEMEELSKKLAIANQELRRLDTAKSEFISIASHQLRTPLTAIRGYISLVLEGSYGEVTATVQDILNKVYVVNNRMSQLVEDLLSISRLESGRIQYNFVETQIEPLVADIVDMFTLMAKEKKLDLKIKLPKQSLPKISIDVNKIREVISNLIDNAIKYTKEGSVTVSVDGEKSFVVVKIADTGIGVDLKDAERLFEKFTRSSETMKLDVSGTGLGLYVGKSFVQAHKGFLSVESEGKGKGACFVIKLPIKNPASHDEVV